jgi:hypothetical protein
MQSESMITPSGGWGGIHCSSIMTPHFLPSFITIVEGTKEMLFELASILTSIERVSPSISILPPLFRSDCTDPQITCYSNNLHHRNRSSE